MRICGQSYFRTTNSHNLNHFTKIPISFCLNWTIFLFFIFTRFNIFFKCDCFVLSQLILFSFSWCARRSLYCPTCTVWDNLNQYMNLNCHAKLQQVYYYQNYISRNQHVVLKSQIKSNILVPPLKSQWLGTGCNFKVTYWSQLYCRGMVWQFKVTYWSRLSQTV